MQTSTRIRIPQKLTIQTIEMFSDEFYNGGGDEEKYHFCMDQKEVITEYQSHQENHNTMRN